MSVYLFTFLSIILHRDEIIVDRYSESPVVPPASVIHHSLGLPILQLYVFASQCYVTL